MESLLCQAIDRLEATLEREAGALKEGNAIDLGESTSRKNQSLLELTRLSRSLNPTALDARTKRRLSDLKTRIDENQRILALHVEASREVSGIIARSIERAESDGTYSSSVGRQGKGA